MAKKKASPVKKIAVKKSATKKTVPSKKVVAKKTVPSKKVAAKKTVPSKKKTAKPTKEKSVAKEIKSPSQLLVDAAVEGILEIKGKNISVLDLRSIQNRVCDYYIICQADSNTQVNAIAGSVQEFVRKHVGEKPFHTEGFQNSEWVLVDYVTVVVHVFQTHTRNFYNLEALWADAEVTEIAFE